MPPYPSSPQARCRPAPPPAPVPSALADVVPELWGGSADLAGSNNTTMKGAKSFLPPEQSSHEFAGDYTGRTLHFGIREHAMGNILNAITMSGLTRAYGGTFLVFADYMRGAVRLAAIQHVPSIFVWSHDSIGVGEDGPTHQPIEHLALLRAIPGLDVIRPADANETAQAWAQALLHTDRPSAIILSRQDLLTVDRDAAGVAPATDLAKGGYTLVDADGDLKVVIIATGSEVEVAWLPATCSRPRAPVPGWCRCRAPNGSTTSRLTTGLACCRQGSRRCRSVGRCANGLARVCRPGRRDRRHRPLRRVRFRQPAVHQVRLHRGQRGRTRPHGAGSYRSGPNRLTLSTSTAAQRLRANGALLLASALWGLAFVAAGGSEYVGTFTFTGVRFALGALVLLPIIVISDRVRKVPPATRRAATRAVVWPGIAIGTLLTIAVNLQQDAMRDTPAGN